MKTFRTMFEVEDADKLPMVQWLSIAGNLEKTKTRLIDSDGILLEGLGAESFSIVELIVKVKQKQVVAIVDIYKDRSATKYIMRALDMNRATMRLSEYEEEWEFTPAFQSYLDSGDHPLFNKGKTKKMCIDLVLDLRP